MKNTTRSNINNLPSHALIKKYLFKAEEKNTVYDKQEQSSLKTLYDEQQRCYKNLILYIKCPQKQHYQKTNFMDVHLFQLAEKQRLKLNQEGLLVYGTDRCL